MALYDFKCGKCGNVVANQILPITHQKKDLPMCTMLSKHDKPVRMGYFITQPPMVHWKDPNIDAFRHVALPEAPVVNTMKEHRELMARHDMVDANDHAPPTKYEEKVAREEAQSSVDAITPTAEQAEQLQANGMKNIVDKVTGE